MKSPRVGVGMLMAAVGVVAVNITMWRAVTAYEVAEYTDAPGWHLLVEFVPLSLVPQAALFAAIHRQGFLRVFWLGFLACSAMVLLSRIWYQYDPPVTSCLNPATGRVDDSVYRSRGCAIAPLWTRYFELVGTPLDRYVNMPLADLLAREFQRKGSWVSRFSEAQVMRWVEVIPSCELVILVIFPQLVIASAGGLTTRAIVARRAKHPPGVPITVR